MEQPVLADHPGGVTRPRPRPRLGKALAPYLLSLPAGLWLLVLFLVTLLMAPDPGVTALRFMIVAGLAIVGVKMVLRRRGIQWPPRR